MLQNLYLLHDTSFDEELRRAAIYITDRKVLFNLVEAAHYQLRQAPSNISPVVENKEKRTEQLIDSFLDTIPPDTEEEETQQRRTPTPADATIDYVAYLLQSEANEKGTQESQTPQLKGQGLIDSFLQQEQGRFLLNNLTDEVTDEPVENPAKEETEANEEEYFTETLARIFAEQGRPEEAKRIYSRLILDIPEKSAYFATLIDSLKSETEQ
jgi:hypothetical protein